MPAEPLKLFRKFRWIYYICHVPFLWLIYYWKINSTGEQEISGWQLQCTLCTSVISWKLISFHQTLIMCSHWLKFGGINYSEFEIYSPQWLQNALPLNKFTWYLHFLRKTEIKQYRQHGAGHQYAKSGYSQFYEMNCFENFQQ